VPKDPWSRLAAGASALGVPIDPRFEARARVYIEELGRWNRVSRLTGYRSEAEQIEHLVLDSLLFLAVLPEPAAPLLDIGSGAGVPGLILKLARPQWPVTLVEANRRRANFLRHVVRRLELADVEVREERAEALGTAAGLGSAFRTVTMRAVTVPAAGLELARPFLGPKGRLVVPIGPAARAGLGSTRQVTVAAPRFGLRIHRRFLIIPATERTDRTADVPRETGGVRGPGSGRGEPERRRRQDDDGGQSGRGAGGG
jgi:16S rRNA (guanine527-N7)-methyltransferase